MSEEEQALERHQQFLDSHGREGDVLATWRTTLDFRGSALLAGRNLEGASLSGDFSGVDMSNADLSWGHMNRSTFVGAIARGFFAKKTEMIDADFTAADLSGAQIIKCEAWNAHFVGAILDGARLVEVSFAEADLTRASVRNATLIGVLFRGTDLTAADFSGTTGTVYATTETHPSWEGRDLLEALRARGADVTYVVL